MSSAWIVPALIAAALAPPAVRWVLAAASALIDVAIASLDDERDREHEW